MHTTPAIGHAAATVLPMRSPLSRPLAWAVEHMDRHGSNDREARRALREALLADLPARIAKLTEEEIADALEAADDSVLQDFARTFSA